MSFLFDTAKSIFSGELNEYIENVRRAHEQIIDTVNTDTVLTPPSMLLAGAAECTSFSGTR
ncbi:MAG: hypothetical protein AB3K77_05965 [Methanosarcinaceae archaeon]